jgi:hypothetical protein
MGKCYNPKRNIYHGGTETRRKPTATFKVKHLNTEKTSRDAEKAQSRLDLDI